MSGMHHYDSNPFGRPFRKSVDKLEADFLGTVSNLPGNRLFSTRSNNEIMFLSLYTGTYHCASLANRGTRPLLLEEGTQGHEWLSDMHFAGIGEGYPDRVSAGELNF